MLRHAGLSSAGLTIGCALGVCLLALCDASAQTKPIAAAHSSVCQSDDDDDDDKSKPAPLWKRFAFEGACFEISGSFDAVYQKQKGSAGVSSILSTRQGAISGANEIKTATANFRLESTRQTAPGELNTAFEVKYEKASSDSSGGNATLTEGSATWAGLKAGYMDSQMNFWNGDFQFSATAPKRTVGLAGYEFRLGEDWTLTFAYETGLPTTQSAKIKFVTVYPDDPVASARLHYEADDVSFQLSGLVHELRIDGANPRLAFLNRSSQYKELGWATTGGLTVPVKLGADGSEFSMQASYAVNASPYLGTNADLSSLASSIPVPVTTQGFSIVGSYHHVFSDHWESNVLASYLALDISLPRGSPSVRTRRYAANLIWKPVEDFKIGGEFGYVESDIETGGPLGLVNGASGKALAGYLFATLEF